MYLINIIINKCMYKNMPTPCIYSQHTHATTTHLHAFSFTNSSVLTTTVNVQGRDNVILFLC